MECLVHDSCAYFGIPGVDIGSSAVKVELLRVSATPELSYETNRNIFNRAPQESVVAIKKGVLRSKEGHGLRPRDPDRAGQLLTFPGLEMGRPQYNANSSTHLQIINPKRAFFVRTTEVNPAPLLEEMGLPAAVQGVADAAGYLNLQVDVGGTMCCFSMQDIAAFFNWHALQGIMHQKQFNAVPILAATVPNGAYKAYRAAVAASYERLLSGMKGKKGSIFEFNLRDPLVLVVPECVASARLICERATPWQQEQEQQQGQQQQQQEGGGLLDGTRVGIVDVGHSTIQAAVLTYNRGRPPTHLVHKAHNGRGVQDIELGLLADVANLLPEVLVEVMMAMADVNKLGLGFSTGNNLQKHLRDSLEKASTIDGPPDTPLGTGPAALELQLSDVQKQRGLLADGVQQVLACLLELNAARCKLDAAYGPPEHVFLTGGGGQVPEVLTCVRETVQDMLGWNQQEAADFVVPSKGGNCPEVAEGAALLGLDLYRQLQQQQQLEELYQEEELELEQQQQRQQQQQQGWGHVPRTLPAPGADYQDLLPELWQGPAGVYIGVFLEFDPSKLSSSSISKLQDLQRRILPAAAPITGPDGQLDFSRRRADGAAIQKLLQQRIQVLQDQKANRSSRTMLDKELARLQFGTAAEDSSKQQRGVLASSAAAAGVPDRTPIFYAVVLPEEDLPRQCPLPWPLYVPADCSEIALRVVNIDPLHGEDEVTVGYADIECEATHFVELTLQVDQDCGITYKAIKKANKKDPGQRIHVKTDHDKLAAERRDAQRRLPKLPQLARQFKRWLSGQEPMDRDAILVPQPEQYDAAAAAAAAAAVAAGEPDGNLAGAAWDDAMLVPQRVQYAAAAAAAAAAEEQEGSLAGGALNDAMLVPQPEQYAAAAAVSAGRRAAGDEGCDLAFELAPAAATADAAVGEDEGGAADAGVDDAAFAPEPLDAAAAAAAAGGGAAGNIGHWEAPAAAAAAETDGDTATDPEVWGYAPPYGDVAAAAAAGAAAVEKAAPTADGDSSKKRKRAKLQAGSAATDAAAAAAVAAAAAAAAVTKQQSPAPAAAAGASAAGMAAAAGPRRQKKKARATLRRSSTAAAAAGTAAEDVNSHLTDAAMHDAAAAEATTHAAADAVEQGLGADMDVLGTQQWWAEADMGAAVAAALVADEKHGPGAPDLEGVSLGTKQWLADADTVDAAAAGVPDAVAGDADNKQGSGLEGVLLETEHWVEDADVLLPFSAAPAAADAGLQVQMQQRKQQKPRQHDSTADTAASAPPQAAAAVSGKVGSLQPAVQAGQSKAGNVQAGARHNTSTSPAAAAAALAASFGTAAGGGTKATPTAAAAPAAAAAAVMAAARPGPSKPPKAPRRKVTAPAATAAAAEAGPTAAGAGTKGAVAVSKQNAARRKKVAAAAATGATPAAAAAAASDAGGSAGVKQPAAGNPRASAAAATATATGTAAKSTVVGACWAMPPPMLRWGPPPTPAEQQQIDEWQANLLKPYHERVAAEAAAKAAKKAAAAAAADGGGGGRKGKKNQGRSKGKAAAAAGKQGAQVETEGPPAAAAAAAGGDAVCGSAGSNGSRAAAAAAEGSGADSSQQQEQQQTQQEQQAQLQQQTGAGLPSWLLTAAKATGEAAQDAPAAAQAENCVHQHNEQQQQQMGPPLSPGAAAVTAAGAAGALVSPTAAVNACKQQEAAEVAAEGVVEQAALAEGAQLGASNHESDAAPAGGEGGSADHPNAPEQRKEQQAATEAVGSGAGLGLHVAAGDDSAQALASKRHSAAAAADDARTAAAAARAAGGAGPFKGPKGFPEPNPKRKYKQQVRAKEAARAAAVVKAAAAAAATGKEQLNVGAPGVRELSDAAAAAAPPPPMGTTLDADQGAAGVNAAVELESSDVDERQDAISRGGGVDQMADRDRGTGCKRRGSTTAAAASAAAAGGSGVVEVDTSDTDEQQDVCETAAASKCIKGVNRHGPRDADKHSARDADPLSVTGAGSSRGNAAKGRDTAQQIPLTVDLTDEDFCQVADDVAVGAGGKGSVIDWDLERDGLEIVEGPPAVQSEVLSKEQHVVRGTEILRRAAQLAL